MNSQTPLRIPKDNTTYAQGAIEGFSMLFLIAAGYFIYYIYHHFYPSDEEQFQPAIQPFVLFSFEHIMLAVIAGLSIYTIIFFLCWIGRAYSNLAELHVRGLAFSPGLAVGGWFIPLANLYIPYRAVSDIWKKTNEALCNFTKTEMKDETNPAFSWWTFWLIASIVPIFVAYDQVLNATTQSAHAPSNVFIFSMIGSGSRVISLYLAIRMLRKIRKREKALRSALEEMMKGND
ncbi:MAG TPA: DUF4328 domain-containing protein [Bacteroidia bacterium]|jgi:hypothetical protein|nr:DUF4328 domain-containing protein [Bacteroidia bacterium]